MRRLALVISLFSGTTGFWFGHQTRTVPRANYVSRLVLAHDVESGAVLTDADVRPFSTPAETAFDFTVPSDARAFIIGKALNRARTAGEQISWLDLDTKAESPVVKRGRAAVLDVSARTPWLNRDDHLDVLASFSDPQTNELVTVTLLQNVIVLGAEKIDTGQRLTLLVIPEEAELLHEAQRLGQVEVTLRNPDDVDILEERGRATINTLMSGERLRVLQQKRFYSACTLRRAP